MTDPSTRTSPELRPLFVAAEDQPVQRRREARRYRDREFELLVNADLRDKFAAGPAYAVLSKPENLVRWLQVLTTIRQSILSQNTHDNTALRAHPDRPSGGPAVPAYAEAKRAVDERKRSRERTRQAVVERVGEVRRLIGVEPVSPPAVGIVVHQLLHIDLVLQDGDIEAARGKLAALLRTLHPSDEAPRA